MTGLGKLYDSKNMTYMSAYRRPVTFMLRKVKDTNMYSIDGDSGIFPKSNQILMNLGKSLEGMLTIEEDKFLKLVDTSKEPP
eukprot:CAMPEP_0168316612 /NCGR_PEP_ID=MMETSP0210-20121227/17110_1 /TAXON_ID=40633 /ORGANISM="Condylostoma magnum, Strain COL2" /LENGTH=81 /DNA_ID=CAMNT_0008300333 /DNA_START=446 /DNA_END=691 /DNA_ORIENTATION=+